MAWNDAMMVSSRDDQEKVVPLWLRRLASANFYSSCETHLAHERNIYCRVCMVSLCEKCKRQHDVFEHGIIKAYKSGKDATFRMKDLKPLWDISHVCPYICNKCPVAYIDRRGARIARPGGHSGAAECKSCQYQIKSPRFKYCSVECKIEAIMKMNGGGSVEKEPKKKVENTPEGSVSNVQSFRKRPRKQKYPQRAPFF